MCVCVCLPVSITRRRFAVRPVPWVRLSVSQSGTEERLLLRFFFLALDYFSALLCHFCLPSVVASRQSAVPRVVVRFLPRMRRTQSAL